MTPEQAFGQVLRQLRREQSVTQEQLALKSGYHRTYISLLERWERSPSLKTIQDIAKSLNTLGSAMIEQVEETLSHNQSDK